MELIDKRVYYGRNIYSHKPCLRLTVDIGRYEDVPTKDIQGFNERLLQLLPGLEGHYCTVGFKGGFCERLREGTYLPHVLEHMMIEMQNSMGFSEVRFGKARQMQGSVYHIIVQYEMAEAALKAGDIAIEWINSMLYSSVGYDFVTEMQSLRKQLAHKRLGPSTKGICTEAQKRNIPVMRLSKDSLFQLGYGCRQCRIEATLTDRTSCLGVDISCDKEMTKEILRYHNIPIAEGYVGDNLETVRLICRKMGYPLVIKPFNGSKGRGVTVDINNEEEAIEAYHEAGRINSRVIVERFIKGDDYRLLVVDGKLAAAAHRTPPCVFGDGIHTLRQLIEKENENPLRGYDHENALTKIQIDDIMIGYIRKSGLTLESVPTPGKRIMLRFNANLSTGGEAVDCTELVHPEIADAAVKAAAAVGLDIAGVDICSSDISVPFEVSGGGVLEVNAAPGIRMHLMPSNGNARNVTENILDYLFGSSNGTIPIVSITGTNGKTTVTRLIAHIMGRNGYLTGMCCTGGIYIGDKEILKGDTTGPESARMVLMDRSVEAAVLETARGGILRGGLGYDKADVAVITNISEDHLGIDGINTVEEMIHVKALVAEAVQDDGYVVLNGEDENVYGLKASLKARCIVFSKDIDHPSIKAQKEQAGAYVSIHNGSIVLYDGQQQYPVAGVNEVPMTMMGLLQYNVENALAGVAACYGVGLSVASIRMGLYTFLGDENYNPGRFNIYKLKHFNVVVDYGHNIEAMKAVGTSLRQMKTGRLIGIIGVPGDRNNNSIVDIGRIAAEYFDFLWIKEDHDKRGRAQGEVARLLEKGVLASKRDIQYEVVLDEGEALRLAMENGMEGDTVIVFYENHRMIVETIENYQHENNKVKIEENVV